MNILLIYPTTLDERGTPRKFRKAYLPPLSLAILHALTPKQHRVRILNDVVETIDYEQPVDLVGITAMTCQIGRAYQIADAFRARGVRVVIGGVHATFLPEEAGKHADSVVLGEAEELWETVLDDAEQNRLHPTYRADSLPDLNRPVIPDWSGFDFSHYMINNTGLPMLPIYTTRGCPLGCDFCSVTEFFDKGFRTKPIEHVLDEINALPNADTFFFVDDTIDIQPAYARELFQAVASNSKKTIRWMSQCTTRIHRKRELLERARKAGCYSLFIGVESLSQEVLTASGKGFNSVDRYDDLFRALTENGILGIASMILGFDQDEEESILETARFFSKHPTVNPILWLLTPLPGTQLFEDMNKQGRLLHTDWSLYDLNHVVFSPKQLNPQRLNDLFWQVFSELYAGDKIRARSTALTLSGYEHVPSNHFNQRYSATMINKRLHPYSSGLLPV
ncbi:MAG: B12-binding domain-containing radical SAM protein [Magnetococcales bacterium]|nr:B12-binding domain-containing radical SAM protein [Magnetococcales bacterium]